MSNWRKAFQVKSWDTAVNVNRPEVGDPITYLGPDYYVEPPSGPEDSWYLVKGDHGVLRKNDGNVWLADFTKNNYYVNDLPIDSKYIKKWDVGNED
jgi:hypothetical protein